MLKRILLKNREKGYDGGKKISGRKRHIVVDTLGYPMKIDVHSANPHDSTCAKRVLHGLKDKFPRLKKVLGDRGYQGDLQSWFHLHTKGCKLTLYLKHLYYGTAKKASITSDNLSSKVILSFIHLFIFAQNFSIGFKSGL